MNVSKLFVALVLAACTGISPGDFSTHGDPASSVKDTPSAKYHRNDALLGPARLQFVNGNYGRSFSLYKKATQLAPSDPQAWLGYAASADMLGRFDKSDTGLCS